MLVWHSNQCVLFYQVLIDMSSSADLGIHLKINFYGNTPPIKLQPRPNKVSYTHCKENWTWKKMIKQKFTIIDGWNEMLDILLEYDY